MTKKLQGFINLSGIVYSLRKSGMALLLAVTGTLSANAQCVVSSVDPSCAGSTDGSVTAFYNDGTGSLKKYELYVEGAFRDSAFSTNPHTFKNVPAGNMDVVMYTQTSGSWTQVCTKPVLLREPAVLNAVAFGTSAACPGTSGGYVDLTITGGTPPYKYSWSNGDSTQDLNGVPAGSYFVLITDVRGCMANATANVTQGAPISFNIAESDVKCKGDKTGSADVSMTGGAGPFTFLWSNGASSEDISGVSAGVYSVIITDANGCSTTQSVTITEPSKGIAAAASVKNVNCAGSSDGSVDITVDGGVGPFEFSWSNGANQEDLNGLAGGTYVVTVKDNSGCTSSQTVNIAEPDPIATAVTTYMGCESKDAGSAAVAVSGGTSPYQYMWSNGKYKPEIKKLVPGSYTVTIVDANGCVKSDTATVEEGDARCIIVPDAFSPNNDGVNDTWIIKNIENYPHASVEVFNQAGQLIFVSKGYSFPWDGVGANGKTVDETTYYYVIIPGDGSSPYTGPLTVLK